MFAAIDGHCSNCDPQGRVAGYGSMLVFAAKFAAFFAAALPQVSFSFVFFLLFFFNLFNNQ